MTLINLIYEGRKEGSLFCTYEIPLNWDASDRVLGDLVKLSRRRRKRRRTGAWAFGSMMFWTCNAKVLEY